jgi:hypothetical protein
MPINTSSSDEGVTGAAKFVTSAVGVRFLLFTISFSFFSFATTYLLENEEVCGGAT